MYIFLLVALFVAFILGRLLIKELQFRSERHKNPVPASPKSGPFFDSNFRKILQPSALIMSRSGIYKGMTVLDLGCGSGAYATETAKLVGKNGKVYATDLQQEMLSQLKNKLKLDEFKNTKNIVVKQADATKLPFKSNMFDLVYMVDVLQEIPDRKKALMEIKRVLKPTGILSITEYFMDPDFVFKSQTISMCEAAGFKKVKVFGSFFHYTIQFKNK